MKIYYCVRSLSLVPSCIYNIRMLKDLGYDVIPVIGDLSDEMKNLLDGIKINIITGDSAHESKDKSRLLITGLYTAAIKEMNKRLKKEDMVIFGTLDSLLYAFPFSKKHGYVLCLKEMYDRSSLVWRLAAKYFAKNAIAVICCEKNRAQYAKFKWDLKELPYVLSNKPYGHPQKRNLDASNEKISGIIDRMNEKTIVYQSKHIWYGDEVAELARGLSLAGDNDIQLVIIGEVDDESLKGKVEAIYPNIIWAGHIHAPLHLEITSHAKIGIAVYAQNCLNNLFCAPNKTYEYAGFSMPTLCSDSPGLTETVGLSRAGICTKWKAENIAAAVSEMFENYDEYSENSKKFFEGEDNKKKIGEIIEDIKKRMCQR